MPTGYTLSQLVAMIDSDFERRGLTSTTAEQILCLADPSRYEESMGMLDDWEARCGLSGSLRGEVADWLRRNAERDAMPRMAHYVLIHGNSTMRAHALRTIRDESSVSDAMAHFQQLVRARVGK